MNLHISYLCQYAKQLLRIKPCARLDLFQNASTKPERASIFFAGESHPFSQQDTASNNEQGVLRELRSRKRHIAGTAFLHAAIGVPLSIHGSLQVLPYLLGHGVAFYDRVLGMIRCRQS